MTNMIKWEQDADGIVTLTMDDPDQGANTMNKTFQDSLAETTERLVAEKDSITGIIITSGKKTFFAGGDLGILSKATKDDAAELEAQSLAMKKNLRTIETLGVPVVAAINGAALGGGLEIALACHRRIALDVKGSEIGLPRCPSACCPVAAASRAPCACSACRRRSWRSCSRASAASRRRPSRSVWSTSW